MTETTRRSRHNAHRSPPRRGQARAALMHAALELVASEANFSAISMRAVARRAGVVPTAFYRHFENMEALGLTLVENAAATLRAILRQADLSALPRKGRIRYSVALFAHHVRDNRYLFQFAVRERYSGTEAVRSAIHAEIRGLIDELASDLRRFDAFGHIDSDDMDMIAVLVVNTVIAFSERILEVAPDDPKYGELMQRTEKQLRLIFMGIAQWRSDPNER